MKLLEFNKFGAPNLDREKGILSGVKILGETSRNGYRYSVSCRQKAKSLFENSKVNIDHHKKGDSSLSARFGKLINITEREDGLYADFNYLTSHPQAKLLEEACEKLPDLFGFSINAVGTSTKDKEGKIIIESIDSVASVDLVSDPATVKGLFEEENEVENEDHYWTACKNSIMEVLDGDGETKEKVRMIGEHLKKYDKAFKEKEEPVEESWKKELANLREEIHALKVKSVVKETKSGQSLTAPQELNSIQILRGN